MGLHQLFDDTTPHLILSPVEAPTSQHLDVLNPDLPRPPWLDINFLDRLDALNHTDHHNVTGHQLASEIGASVAESISCFAHEVRTPLATVHATLEVLSDDRPIDPADMRQLIGRLQRGVMWITELVNNLSATAGSLDDDLPLEIAPTNVRDWIEQAISLVQPIADRREQSILLACPRPAPVVRGDAFRLGQVMVNLLTNACRYGAWADTIAVSVMADREFVSIRVSDHGMGVLPDERERIFERLVRGTQTGECYVHGQGLGLHIVREIIERHQGTISVDSVPGQGSTFCVRLPEYRPAWPIVLRHTGIEESGTAE